jgi:biotin operon repressor
MVSVASGGLTMGSIPCEQGDVLGLMLEDNQRRLQRRLLQMRMQEAPERLTLLTEWPTLDEGCCEQLEAWITAVEKPRLIVVDVFARVRGTRGGRETDYDGDYRQAAMLQSIASKHNLAIVAIHHTRKMNGALVLKRHSETRQPVLYGRGRDMEEIESALEFDKETGTWSVLGAAWQVADTAERREIQQVLGRSVDPLTPTEIAERLGKSRQNIQNMLSKMLDDGKVEQVTRGHYTLMSPVSPVSPELFEETREIRDTTLTHARAA